MERRTFVSKDQIRREILTALKAGPLFSRDIADQLQLTAAAVRHELLALLRHGFVARDGPYQTGANASITAYKYTLSAQGELL